jgi:hypothetical protein
MSLTLLIGPVMNLLDKIIPDKDAAAKAKIELLQQEKQDALTELQMLFEADKSQVAVNTEEAKHSSIFVAGWRPFIGWVCGASLAWTFLLQPIVIWITVLSGFPEVDLPKIPNDALMELVFCLLGLGGFRTYEKIKGISK